MIRQCGCDGTGLLRTTYEPATRIDPTGAEQGDIGILRYCPCGALNQRMWEDFYRGTDGNRT